MYLTVLFEYLSKLHTQVLALSWCCTHQLLNTYGTAQRQRLNRTQSLELALANIATTRRHDRKSIDKLRR